MARIQQGHIYEGNFEGRTFFYVRYYVTKIVNGEAKRVQASERLVEKGAVVPSEEGGGVYCMTKGKPCSALKLKRDGFMLQVNREQRSTKHDYSDMPIADFWELHFLKYCEEILTLTGKSRRKPSTVYGYKQVWRQHLKGHFGALTLRQYEPRLGNRFLQSLTSTQGRNTIRHIRALGSSIFGYAVTKEKIAMNPWREVKIPKDALASEETPHYTLEEAEDMISALVGHVDCQLVIALSCFLGLRPGEIAALRWEDFDSNSVHVRRAVVRGKVDTPKTKESIATIPVVDYHVLIPLKLWRKKSGNPTSGWVFPSEKNTPVDLHNLQARVLVPHINGSGECIRCKIIPEKSRATWKTLYAGRRGACTLVIERTSKPELAQALLRHKRMSTTLDIYKKAITPEAFISGMKELSAGYQRKRLHR